MTPYATLPHRGYDPTTNFMVIKSNYTAIKVYDNNWPDEERIIEVAPRSVGGRFTYRLGPRTVWQSHSLTRTPLSIFTGARHAPGASFISDPALLFRLITAQGVRAEYSNNSGARLGWNAVGLFQDQYPGAAAVVPWAEPYTNRETSTLFAFLPPTNAPQAIVLRVTGSNYCFHAGHDLSSFQLIVSNTVPGSIDHASVLSKGGDMSGLNFRPQLAQTAFTPMISQTLPGNRRRIYRLDGLKLPAGADVDFLTLGEGQGMRIVNRSGGTLKFNLKLDGVDGVTGTTQDALFEALELPGAAAVNLVVDGFDSSGFLRFDLDLGLNGTVDRALQFPAEYVLVIRAGNPSATVEWRVREGEASLQKAPTLVGGVWKTVEGSVTRSGSKRSMQVSPADAQGFFRLAK